MMIVFTKACHYVPLFQEFVNTLVNGRPSFFRIDSIHQMETSLSQALLVDQHSLQRKNSLKALDQGVLFPISLFCITSLFY
jgi:hypothetical protein